MKSKAFIVLKPTEERIVTLLQKYNTLSISEMSKKIAIARTSIYNSLSSLCRKDIVVKNNFLYSLKDGELRKLDITKENSSEKIDKLLNELCNLKRGEIIYSIESDAEIRELFNNKSDFMRWQKKLVNRGIVLKGIGSINALNYFKNRINTDDRIIIKKRSGSARFFGESLDGYCSLVVFRETIVFMSKVKKYFYRIDNYFVSQFFRDIINRVYQNQEYKKLV